MMGSTSGGLDGEEGCFVGDLRDILTMKPRALCQTLKSWIQLVPPSILPTPLGSPLN